MLERIQRNENPSTLFLVMQTGAATVENCMQLLQKMKRDPNIWENIFANYTLDKDLISKIFNELTSLQEDKQPN